MGSTLAELKTLKRLRVLERNWPAHWWLFSGDGVLYIMKLNENGERAVTSSGAYDQKYCVAEIKIPSDGGGW